MTDNVPFCINCAHYGRHPTEGIPLCSDMRQFLEKETKPDVVTGEVCLFIEQYSCYEARSRGACGPEGKRFTPKETNR